MIEVYKGKQGAGMSLHCAQELTYFDLLLLNELVLQEQKKICKLLDSDVRRCVYKIFRPGLFRRMQMLSDLECKLNCLGEIAREKEKQ